MPDDDWALGQNEVDVRNEARRTRQAWPDGGLPHGEHPSDYGNDDDRPSSAGVCQECGKKAEKRYGGEGRYLVVCLDCWLAPSVFVCQDPESAWIDDQAENAALGREDSPYNKERERSE